MQFIDPTPLAVRSVWALRLYFIFKILTVPLWFYNSTFQTFYWYGSYPVGPWGDLAMTLLLFTFLAIQIASFLLFLIWTFRVARNARALGAKNLPTTPAGSVLWYVVPVAFLWKPFVALKDIWAASEDPQNWVWYEVPHIFTIYWTLCVLIYVEGTLTVLGFPIRFDTIETLTAMNVVLAAVILTYTALQIRIIRRITDAQLRSHRQGVFA